jgi:hypothetical protein
MKKIFISLALLILSSVTLSAFTTNSGLYSGSISGGTSVYPATATINTPFGIQTSTIVTTGDIRINGGVIKNFDNSNTGMSMGLNYIRNTYASEFDIDGRAGYLIVMRDSNVQINNKLSVLDTLSTSLGILTSTLTATSIETSTITARQIIVPHSVPEADIPSGNFGMFLRPFQVCFSTSGEI